MAPHPHGLEDPVAVLQAAIAIVDRASRPAVDPGASRTGLPRRAATPTALARVSAKLLRWVRIRNDTGARPKPERCGVRDQGADQNIEVAAAVAVQIADRAGIGTAPRTFEFGDDLHATHLGTAGDGAARKHARITCTGDTSSRSRPLTFDTM
jgi:hypothetical protein